MKQKTQISNEKVCILPNEYLTPSEYIDSLIGQLKSDVYPLFKVKGFAPFTISRNIFCFIDHVSALKYGIKANQTTRIKKCLSEFAIFDNYIQEKYKRYSSYICQVYRHDLVHNIRPFKHKFTIIEKNGNTLKGTSWFFVSSYIGKNPPKPKSFNKLLNYFRGRDKRKNLCHLRYSGNQIVINNYCLFFDLVNYLLEYRELLKDNQKESCMFILNYEAITDKYLEIDDFKLDKRNDKECKFF